MPRGPGHPSRAHHVIAAGLAEGGSPVAWKHKILCQSFAVGTSFENTIIVD